MGDRTVQTAPVWRAFAVASAIALVSGCGRLSENPMVASAPDLSAASAPVSHAKRGQWVFVAQGVFSNDSSAVAAYPPGANLAKTQPRQITAGIEMPSSLAVDSKGRLFVANSTGITMYPMPYNGKKPAATLSIGAATKLLVDRRDNLYAFVPGASQNLVVAYSPALKKPTRTISVSSNVFDFAVNSSGDIFVLSGAGASGADSVIEYAASGGHAKSVLARKGLAAIVVSPHDRILVGAAGTRLGDCGPIGTLYASGPSSAGKKIVFEVASKALQGTPSAMIVAPTGDVLATYCNAEAEAYTGPAVQIMQVTASSNYRDSLAFTPFGSACCLLARGLATDDDGNLYLGLNGGLVGREDVLSVLAPPYSGSPTSGVQLPSPTSAVAVGPRM
jgi:hypothetical protein